MIGYPLDSHISWDPDGIPVLDRAVSSAPLRKLNKMLFSDGVLPNPSTNMQVIAGDGMNVIVSPGFAMCNGCMKLEEVQRTLVVQASSTAYDRIDTVVLRLNDNDSERICDFYIVEGTPDVNPVRPTLTRDGSIWEIGLADLFITKNSTVISNQRITDTRYDTERCGIISSISEFDTTTLYQQVQADLQNFRDVSEEDFTNWITNFKQSVEDFESTREEDFDVWFENLQAQLEGDVAANLQAQIGALNLLETEDKTDLVSAVSEVARTQKVKHYTDISQIGTFESAPTMLELFDAMPDYSVLFINCTDISDYPTAEGSITISKRTYPTNPGFQVVGNAILHGATILSGIITELGESTQYEKVFTFGNSLSPNGLQETDWKVSGADVLDTLEEVEANTDSGKAAGALALKEVYNGLKNIGGGLFDNLLWENEDITQSISSLDIEIDLSEYKAIIVLYYTSNSESSIIMHSIVPIGFNGTLNRTAYYNNTTIAINRNYAVTSAGVSFGNGTQNSTNTPGSNIPYRIYGIK